MEFLEVITIKEANYKIPGGKLVKVKLVATSEKINNVQLLGDFFVHPDETLLVIVDALTGCQKDEELIEKVIKRVLTDSSTTLIGATPADFSKTIMMAWESN
ncbi:MAG: hypothetical protein E4H14_12605 [Candidatus Thorarchaeota archaeon]|nr:MAG: hypothetical protein E4H14_12605 [Candidatus Thorarchaeota archaeon]